VVPVAEPFDLGRGGPAQVTLQGTGDLAYPAIAGLLRIVGGRFDQVERLIDELGMLPEAYILIVCEADVGVAMVDDVQRADRPIETSPS